MKKDIKTASAAIIPFTGKPPKLAPIVGVAILGGGACGKCAIAGGGISGAAAGAGFGGGATAGPGGGGATSGVAVISKPHLLQNFVPSSTGVPHFEQNFM